MEKVYQKRAGALHLRGRAGPQIHVTTASGRATFEICCATSARLFVSIVCAGPSDQVNFNEAPSTADLERWKLTPSGQGAQRHGVKPWARGGLGER
jgi:hypothetical protein